MCRIKTRELTAVEDRRASLLENEQDTCSCTPLVTVSTVSSGPTYGWMLKRHCPFLKLLRCGCYHGRSPNDILSVYHPVDSVYISFAARSVLSFLASATDGTSTGQEERSF